MMKPFATIALCALSLAAGAAVTASAQTTTRPAKAGECIVREQAEQILSTLAQRNEQLTTAIRDLRAAEERIAELEIKAAEADAAKRALEVAAVRNRELVGIGKQILDDYEKMDLGRRTAAREPLTGLYRVQLENKLQAFEDEIAARRVFPERELEAAAQAAPAPTH